MNRAAERAQLAALTTGDPRWLAVVARDAGSDGKFFYSVKTSGVYCRPSCAARLARPENVRFHTTCDDAEKAGFRPCKRCKPDQMLKAARSGTREIHFATGDCSLGSILVARSSRGICAILIDDHPSWLIRDLECRFPDEKLRRDPNASENFLRKVRILSRNQGLRWTCRLTCEAPPSSSVSGRHYKGFRLEAPQATRNLQASWATRGRCERWRGPALPMH